MCFPLLPVLGIELEVLGELYLQPVLYFYFEGPTKSLNCTGSAWTRNPLASASRSADITAVHYHVQFSTCVFIF